MSDLREAENLVNANQPHAEEVLDQMIAAIAAARADLAASNDRVERILGLMRPVENVSTKVA